MPVLACSLAAQEEEGLVREADSAAAARLRELLVFPELDVLLLAALAAEGRDLRRPGLPDRTESHVPPVGLTAQPRGATS